MKINKYRARPNIGLLIIRQKKGESKRQEKAKQKLKLVEVWGKFKVAVLDSPFVCLSVFFFFFFLRGFTKLSLKLRRPS